MRQSKGAFRLTWLSQNQAAVCESWKSLFEGHLRPGIRRHLVKLAGVSLPDWHASSRSDRADKSLHRRQHLGPEQFDRLRDFRVGQAADVDLRQETVMSEHLAFVHDLVDDLLGAADED